MRVIRLLLVLFICAVPALARADTIYQVTGSASITGNPVCNGKPCVETINFSLLFEVVPFDPNAVNLFLLQLDKVVSLESIGPLAPFNSVFFVTEGLAFQNPNHDEIDISTFVLPTSRAFPTLFDTSLYGCRGGRELSPVCADDFGIHFEDGSEFLCCWLYGGTLDYTVETISTPEGNTLLLVGAGLVGLLLAKAASK
jgi:hypothetical protein